MRIIGSRIDAYIVLLSLAIVVATGIWGTFSRREITPDDVAHPIRPGVLLDLNKNDIDWSRAHLSVVLTVSQGCVACMGEESFYSRLGRAVAQRGDVQIIAVSTERSQSAIWLENIGVPIDAAVIDNDPFGQGFITTPTVLVVNSTGRITNMWLGAMDESEENALLEGISAGEIDDPDSASPDGHYALEIAESDLSATLESTRATLIDPRSRTRFARNGRSGAINIPAIEWESRLTHEVDLTLPVILDCHDEIPFLLCRVYGWRVMDEFGAPAAYIVM